jgi:hypothetical protein
MRILLIMPCSDKKKYLFSKFQPFLDFHPSLTLKQIASITPNNHLVKIIDERYQKNKF